MTLEKASNDHIGGSQARSDFSPFEGGKFNSDAQSFGKKTLTTGGVSQPRPSYATLLDKAGVSSWSEATDFE